MSKPVYIKKNGIVNKISSMSIGVNTPFIYSEDEREVGVWIDGKPLYQKTISFTNLSAGSNYIDVDVSNISEVIMVSASAQVPSGAWIQIPLTYDDLTNITKYAVTLDGYDPSTGKITIKIGTNRTVSNGYLTIQYTKTTDTPGSGKWSNNGGPAHHYSTSEQVVGTWIDGKPIYEKTVNTGSFTTGYGTVSHNILNIDNIISYYFIAKRSDANGGWFDNNSVGNDILFTVNKTEIYRQSNSISCEKSYLTIQYTKTTD